MKKLYTLAALLFVFALSNAQISKGKDFWIGYMDNIITSGNVLKVFVTCEAPTNGIISIPGTGWSQTFTATPGVSTLLLPPLADAMVVSDDVITNQGVHVVTDECVSIFAYNGGEATADATVVSPINSIGDDYIINTYEESATTSGASFATEFVIVGNYVGTTISITPMVTAGSHAAGVPYTITLDSGFTYQLKANGDLTGSRVTGTNGKNFSVFAGNYCTTVNNQCCCDHIYDQLTPISNLGMEYVTVPYGMPQTDKLRVVAVQSGTTVLVNGTPVATLAAGQKYDFNSSQVNFITSNKNISVAQLMSSAQVGGGGSNSLGDPFTIMQSPTAQRINVITFPTIPLLGGTGNPYWYLNLVAKTTDVPNITLDGTPVSGSFTTVLSNPNYSTAHISLVLGDHTIVSNEGVIGYVYGYSDYYESFGYQAGVRVQIPHIAAYDTSHLLCPGDYVPLTLNTPDTTRTIYIEWDYGDGSPHTVGTFYTGHTYNNYGDYPVTIIYELLSACKRDTMTIDTVKVRGPNVMITGPTQFCSPQTNVTLNAISQFAITGLLWSTGSTANSITINVPTDTIITITASNATCAGYDTARIYVGSDTASFIAGNSCEGVPTIFTNTSKIIPNAIYTWLWDFGDGSTAVQASPQHQYATGGTYQVKMKFTSPAGCSDSISKPITIYAKPNVDIVVNRVCNDSIYMPINNSTISSGIMSFDWNFGDGTAHDTTQYPSHKYAQSGAYNITLVASSGGGACKDSVTLPQNIIIGAEQEFSGIKVCMGQTTQFTDLTVNSSGSAILSYNWDFGDANTSTQQNPSHTYSVEGSYQATLLLDYGSNCYDSIKHNVTVNPIPAADFTVADLCNGGTATPINASTVTTGNMNMNWNFGDNTATVNGLNPSHTYALSGNYNIQLIAVSDSACSDTVFKPLIVIRGTTMDFTAPSVCEGGATTFTDQTINPYNTTINSYAWDFDDGNSSPQQNTAHTYTTFGTYNVELKLDYGNNCADSLTKTVTVNEIPVAAFTIADVCNDNIATPVNTSSISAGAMNYSWLFGDGSVAATGLNPSHTYSQSNTYTVQLITSIATGCADTATAPVIITIGTQIDFTAPAVCEGNTTTFTDQTANPYNTTINSYTWDLGNGNSSAQQNTTHTYTTFGTYNVELKLDYGNNCADSLTKVVTVNENPVAAFTVSDVCNDSMVTPVNNSAISAGVMNYSWLFGDGTSAASGLNPSHVYSQSNTYTIQLIASTAGGCADTTSNPVNIIVGTTINFTTFDLCEGATSAFNDQTTNPYNTTITGYSWSFGDGNSSTQQNTTHVYATAGNYNVQLKLDYGNTCADSLTQPVTVNPNPVADFNSTIPCIGNNIQLTDASTPVGNIYGWAWDLGDGATTNTQNGAHNYAAAGNYNVQLIATTNVGCKDTVQKQVTVLGKGNAQFTASNVCNPNTTPFTNTTDVATYPVGSFDWNFGDGTGTSTQTDPSYTYASAGVYQVTIIANFSNGCADTSTQEVEVYVIPTVTDVIQNVSCFGGNDGSIQLTPNIGQQPFTYLWNNSLITSGISSLTIGNYTVTFTDAHTCTASAVYVVSEPTSLFIDTAISPITCFDYSDGAIIVTATNGTPGYFYNWSNGNTTNIASQLSAGTYSVTVSDSKNCSVTTTVTLNNPPAYTILLETVVSVNLGETVLLAADATNGNPISWLWSPDNYLSCATCQQTEAGPYYNYVYNVQSVDDKGCIAKSKVQVNVVPKYEVFIPNVFTPNSDGANDYFEVFGNKQAWKQFEVLVFNRIGEKVYESNDMNFKWDGTYKSERLSPTVLVYLVKVIYLNNYSEKIFKGSLTLIR